MKWYLIIFLLITFSIPAYSQQRDLFIDSIKILPSHLTDADSITIIAYVMNPSSNILYSHSVQVDSDFIQINDCYLLGQDQTSYHNQDTIILAPQPAGFYTLLYALKQPTTQEIDTSHTCDSYPWVDSAFQQFTISYATATPYIANSYNITLYPTPASNQLHGNLTGITSKCTARIISVDGKILIDNLTVTQNNFDINIAPLPAGLYFLQLQNENQLWVRKFVKE